MTRTTIGLDESLLKQTKKIAQQEHATLGETISELISLGIQSKLKRTRLEPCEFTLPSFSLGVPIIPIEDKEALFSALEKKHK
ncbi:MAG: hypothetical protein V1913_14755 [Fibrobacterota bacterium]